MPKSYDPKCEELARHFLPTTLDENDPRFKELAQIIQDTIESYLNSM